MPRAARCGCTCGPRTALLEGGGDGAPNRVSGVVSKVEFLGGWCVADLCVDELDGLPLHLSFSLNQLHDLSLQVGARLDLALRADRIRVFAAKESHA
jgi:iron(III) transport system ATP-binding protein